MAVALVSALVLGIYSEVSAQSSASSYAVLIVGDESKPTMAANEKALIAEMTKLLTSRNEAGSGFRFPASRAVQVFSYHFNQEREKQYCEKKLNILSEDLLFVGVIELKDRFPRRVVYRIDRIVNAKRSALDIISYLEDTLTAKTTQPAVVESPKVSEPSHQPAVQKPQPAEPANKPSSVASPAAATTQTSAPITATKPRTKPSSSAPVIKPVVTSSPSEVAAPPASKPAVSQPVVVKEPVNDSQRGYWRCQVGSFGNAEHAKELVDDLNGKGYQASTVQIERNGAPFFRVYVGAYTQRVQAEATLAKLKKAGYSKAILSAPARQ